MSGFLNNLNLPRLNGQTITTVDEQFKVHGQRLAVNVCRDTENREGAELLKLLGNTIDVVEFDACNHDVSFVLG